MILIFALAVLLPSAVLGLLALRAADREAAYVERSLEAALLAEVNLAAQKISSLLDELAAELGREARKISGPGDLEEMRALPPLPPFLSLRREAVFSPPPPILP